MKTISCLLLITALFACNGNTGNTARRRHITHNNDSLHRFADDLTLLQQQTPLVVLKDSTGKGSIAITPAWQGRVLLSATDAGQGVTIGWINRNAQEPEKGGEDNWTDSTGTAFTIKKQEKQSVQLEKKTGRTHMLRTISLIARRDIMNYIGVSFHRHVNAVAFESDNVIVNTDTAHAQLAVKITGCFPGSAEDVRWLIPDKPHHRFNIIKPGEPVAVRPDEACNYFGLYDAEQNLLTIIQFTMPEGKTVYTDNAVIFLDTGNKPELAVTSPTVTLKPGASLQHYHRTIHLSGTDKQLDPVLKKVFGTTIKALDATF